MVWGGEQDSVVKHLHTAAGFQPHTHSHMCTHATIHRTRALWGLHNFYTEGSEGEPLLLPGIVIRFFLLLARTMAGFTVAFSQSPPPTTHSNQTETQRELLISRSVKKITSPNYSWFPFQICLASWVLQSTEKLSPTGTGRGIPPA